MTQTIKNILIEHYQRYPLMEIVDFIKLIYQNEFGPRHIADANAYSCLINEYENAPFNNSQDVEDIGNGFCRVNLFSYKGNIDDLYQKFISSCNQTGSLSSFLRKIDELKELTKDGYFSFTIEELEIYLEEYKKMDYPSVSHSLAYKTNYHPSYRIILKNLLV